MLLVEEAGGKVTDFAGERLHFQARSSVAASNGKVHDELLGLL